MSDSSRRPIQLKAKTDFGEAAMILGIFALIILFWGDPDLHDAWVASLNPTPPVATEPDAPTRDADAPTVSAEPVEPAASWTFYRPYDSETKPTD